MLKRFSPALVVAAGLVGAALILRSSPQVGAGGAKENKPVFFRASFPEGDETPRVMGTVPEGRTLLLKDFWPINGASARFEILADGVAIWPINFDRGAADNIPTTFSVGIKVPSGKEIAIRRIGLGSTFAIDLQIDGILQ